MFGKGRWAQRALRSRQEAADWASSLLQPGLSSLPEDWQVIEVATLPGSSALRWILLSGA